MNALPNEPNTPEECNRAPHGQTSMPGQSIVANKKVALSGLGRKWYEKT